MISMADETENQGSNENEGFAGFASEASERVGQAVGEVAGGVTGAAGNFATEFGEWVGKAATGLTNTGEELVDGAEGAVRTLVQGTDHGQSEDSENENDTANESEEDSAGENADDAPNA